MFSNHVSHVIFACEFDNLNNNSVKPLEKRKAADLLSDIADKENCSEKQRYSIFSLILWAFSQSVSSILDLVMKTTLSKMNLLTC